MKKLITHVKELNQLLKQGKLDIIEQKIKELKKLFPNDDVPVYLESYIFENEEQKQKIENKTNNKFRIAFFLQNFLKDTDIIKELIFERKADNLLLGIFLFDLFVFDFEKYVYNPSKIKTTINSLYKVGYTKTFIFNSLFFTLGKIETIFKYYNIKEKKEKFLNKIADLLFNFHVTPVDKIYIKNYFSIEQIELDNLNNKKEIYFLGENGDGKTILLQAILLSLKGNTGNEKIFSFINQNEKFQKKINAENKLFLSAKMKKNAAPELINIYDYKFNPNHKEQKNSYENIFAYGVSRLRKSDKDYDQEGYLTLFDSDISLISPTQWLKDVQLDYLNYQNKKANNELKKDDIEPMSSEKTKKLLEQIINFEETENQKFNIEINGTEIKFKEKGTELEFEQLSDGYKSILILLSDLLSRLSKNQPFIDDAKNYYGIVIIDELGVFLHPKWEFSIARILRKLFPNIQWIFSTHSPIAILGASEDAVFYKLYKEDSKTKISKSFSPKTFSNKLISGLITSPLFNMPTAKPATYQYSDIDYETGDYIYSKIHNEVKKRLEKEPLQDVEVKNMVKNLLDEFEKTNK